MSHTRPSPTIKGMMGIQGQGFKSQGLYDPGTVQDSCVSKSVYQIPVPKEHQAHSLQSKRKPMLANSGKQNQTSAKLTTHLPSSGHCWEPPRDLGCLGVTHYSPFGSLVQSVLQKGHGRFEWTTDLDSLAALLGISQQLDGESPRVLKGILEVGEAVTPVAAQRALSADGNRAGVAVQMQNLRTRNTSVSTRGSIALTLDSNSPPPNMVRPLPHQDRQDCHRCTLDAYCLGPEGNPHPSAGRQSWGSYRVALLAYGWGRRGLPVSQQNDMEGSMISCLWLKV